MLFEGDEVSEQDITVDQSSIDQETSLSEVDELRELIEQLRIRQRRTERRLVETSEELGRVSRELEVVRIEQSRETPTEIFNKGDKVLVTTRTKNRYGDLAVVYYQPYPASRFVWVLPEGKLPGSEYKVTRKYLKLRS